MENNKLHIAPVVSMPTFQLKDISISGRKLIYSGSIICSEREMYFNFVCDKKKISICLKFINDNNKTELKTQNGIIYCYYNFNETQSIATDPMCVHRFAPYDKTQNGVELSVSFAIKKIRSSWVINYNFFELMCRNWD